MPNGPDHEPVTVQYGPMQFPEQTDTLTIFLSSSGRRRHDHILGVKLALLDREGHVVAAADVGLPCGGTASRALALEQAGRPGATLRMEVAFEKFAGGGRFGNVSISYLLVHRSNELVKLFNAAGSDKGTEIGVGPGAVPHCYAVEYYGLFQHLRDRPFKLLEIGLQSDEKDGSGPTDAPSLRVWHDFFPWARIYGFDVNDFSFFHQSRTTIFRGDQGSPKDLQGFIAEHAHEKFELIIDDGSHASSDQQTSLATLFSCLAAGGLYVIEDLHWQPRPESPTTLELLRMFNESSRIESPFIDEAAARDLERTIDRVEIHKPNDSEFAAIYKKAH
jgi:hypothetical protein